MLLPDRDGPAGTPSSTAMSAVPWCRRVVNRPGGGESAFTAMSLVAEHIAGPIAKILASDRVLAVVEFEVEGSHNDNRADPRHIVTGLRSLVNTGTCEVWRCSEPVTWGWDDALRWACGEQVLFAAVTADASADRDLEAVAYGAWQRLLQFSAGRGFPHIVRAWNHVPRINEGAGDDERYKRFCRGRGRAFDALGYGCGQYPASSAVGNDGTTLVAYLFACTEPGRHHENPRQVSAYSYPRRYGPRPPSFARATAKVWGEATHVYVSGTASIVGHRSRYGGNVDGQIAVTFDNVDRLLHRIDGKAGSGMLDLLRVYVRDPANLARVMAGVGRFAPHAAVVYVRADICRCELALEIEGVRQQSTGSFASATGR